MPINVVKINILGTEYPIKGDSDSEYIKDVAEYVNSKMEEVDRTMTTKSPLKTAILASLNIADELFKEKETKEALVKQFNERIEKILSRLNDIE